MSKFSEWRERRSMRNVARPYGMGLDLSARPDGRPANPRDLQHARQEVREGRLLPRSTSQRPAPARRRTR